jgi:DNA-binding NtrC family response regulator
MADARSGMAASSFEVGATYRVTGIGGQRASRKGALDGYRLWLRGAADVQRLAGPPAAGSTPESGAGSYQAAVNAYRRELIVAALGRTGGNRAAAAASLGLNRTHFLRLLRALAIE